MDRFTGTVIAKEKIVDTFFRDFNTVDSKNDVALLQLV
jgi:hypothetical protein